MTNRRESDKKLPQHVEETWEEANCSAAAYTPHSSRRIPFYTSSSSSFIDIQSVDTSSLTLLDVCNYTVEKAEVDGSGHCVWMGSIFWIHALSMSIADAGGTSSSSWFKESYFQNRQVAEMGCGTGAAGIAMIKLLESQLSSSSSCRPTCTSFLDNDPEALELCQKNCQQNGVQESRYKIQLQEPWADLSATTTASTSNGEQSSKESFCFDTILATDVLYDLKIIRPFLQTASRFLKKSSTTNNNIDIEEKHLILSHVPRWFLPRDNNNNNKEQDKDYSASQALEKHIVKEASQIGFQLIHTVRPRQVREQHKQLLQRKGSNNGNPETEFLDSLREMEEANAVLWVLRLETHG